MFSYLRKLKRGLFSAIRRMFLLRKLADVAVFLEATEIEKGIKIHDYPRVLVLAPHPDDETFGCGGTIRLMADQGFVIDVLFLTAGERGVPEGTVLTPHVVRQMKRKRMTEASLAARVLGVRQTVFLNGSDGELHNQLYLAEEVRSFMLEGDYRLILCPWPHDGHSDHVYTFRIFGRAVEDYPNDLQVWLYENWAPLLANRVVNIDSTIARKIEAIRCYASQAECMDYATKLIGLAQYRSMLLPQAKHAEAFLTGDLSLVQKFYTQVANRMDEKKVVPLARPAAAPSKKTGTKR